MNRKFGKNSVYLASTHRSKDTAKEKIAFQKTALFSEGLGDNVIFDTFRGIRTMDN
jgi:DNA polymerase-4